jgi:hypothetical protein
MSSNFTNHFSADDAALVLIDFQPQSQLTAVSVNLDEGRQ